jgi:hypothetical protein
MPQAYTAAHAADVAAIFGRPTMAGKIVKSNKEAKKQPLLSPKEKKAAKQAKKSGNPINPIGSKTGS